MKTNHAHNTDTTPEHETEMHGNTRQSGIVRAAKRSTPEHEAGASLVDALEDILKWERQSERLLRVADDSTAS